MNILKEIDIFITDFINNVGFLAPLIASFLIFMESILPVLPLSLFITVNFYYYGTFFGFLISYFLTCLGCYLSYIFCRKKVKFWFDNKINKKYDLAKWMKAINNLSLEKLVVLIVIPFTPAFLVNIVSGLSSMKEKKFLIAILIGKIFLVYFWGFVGTSLIDSIKNPKKLIIISILMLIAFLISKIVNKKYRIE